MRQGAIAFLPNADFVPTNWVQVPLRDLIQGGDSEARVSLWIRNNASDAIDTNGGGDWITDTDGRVVLTAMATIRNTSIAIEQELKLTPGNQKSGWSMATPDVAYGGGHNNDNVMADVCAENALGYNANGGNQP
jgi:hypothetical protein